jgi:hypothetical protein
MAHLGGREGGERLQQPLHELEEQGERVLAAGLALHLEVGFQNGTYNCKRDFQQGP